MAPNEWISAIAASHEKTSLGNVSWQTSGAMRAQHTITSMVALDPNTSETTTWDILDEFLKLHSRAREQKTTDCTEDSAGNRTVKNADTVRTTSLYDAANQLRYNQAAAGRTTFAYDSAGNQQLEQPPAGSRTTTTWDYENQPILYRLPDASRVTMSYNSDSRRVIKESASETVKFVWDPVADAYLSELDVSNTTQVVYTQEPQQFGRVISQRRSSTSNWYHTDSLGSTRALTNVSQVVSDTYLCDAWGNPISSTGTTVNPFRWVGNVGYYFDTATGLFYIRARTYQPTIARWTSVDPLFALLALKGMRARDPIGYAGGSETLYSYCDSKVLKRLDPTGLASCTVKLVCVTLGGLAEHCGIETSTDGGATWNRWHVVSPGAGILSLDTCDVQNGRITTPIWTNPWREISTWQDPTGQLCSCIDSEAPNIRNRRLPYWPTPSNNMSTGWDGKCYPNSPCNSNYSTHCMMKRCGITADRGWAPGWDHRMSRCAKETKVPCGGCACLKWEPIDQDWCGDAPNPPRYQPVS